MNNNQPLVSIGIFVYNEEKFIAKTIESWLNQDYQNIEIVISDNASEDKTFDIAQQYAKKDHRIILNRNSQNLGAAFNGKKVFEMSTGKYFIWSSGHDDRDTKLLSYCVKVLESNQNIVLAYPQANWINEKGEIFDSIGGCIETRGLDTLSRLNIVLWGLGYASPVYGLFRTEVLTKVSLGKSIIAPDVLLLSELSILGEFAYIPRSLLKMRRMPDYGSWNSYVSKIFNQSLSKLSIPEIFWEMLQEFIINITKHINEPKTKQIANYLIIQGLMTKYGGILGVLLNEKNTSLSAKEQVVLKKIQNISAFLQQNNEVISTSLIINFTNSQKSSKSVNIPETQSPIILIDGVFFQLYKTGIARVWKSLLEQWANTDFANHIVVLDRTNSAPKFNGIRYRTIQAYEYNNTEADKRVLQQICDEERAELFISTYYTTPLTTPSVFMAYDMIPEVCGWNLQEIMWREKHQAINHALGYIAISHNTAKDLSKIFPQIKAESVTVAHCGVDTATFFPPNPAEVQQFKAKYQIQKPYFLLTSLGSYKNTTLFFEGFSRLVIRDNFAVVVTGAASKIAEQLQQQLQGQSVNLTIHPLDLSDDELRLAYAGAVALVYPSKYEGFGMPVIEAMACGCPVITTRNASLPEAGGDAALYINDSDVGEMTNALLKVLDLETRTYLINEGLKQAQKFSWATMAQTIEQSLRQTIDHINNGEIKGNNVLRIGYISPDFRDHPVGNFIEPIIRRHNRTQVKVYCYSETLKRDEVTNIIKNKADVWRETKGLSDQEVADLIKQDNIDILIDLAGHTEGNRLDALALKPAPIQATYLGYFASTGSDAIDYWITDNYIHPENSQEEATEQIWRLPRCYLGYRPRPEAPFVNDAPCLSQDFITFGSFNNYSKLNPLVLQTWAEILRQIPNSQLIIKNDHQDLDDPEERASIEEYLQANGLNIEQVKLVSRQTTSMNYLALYHAIDIHLDIFPYNGCTTTCDALWMGVPVLTLAGNKYIQRMGTSILTTVGLEDWVAHNTEEYIQKAVKFAQNKSYLQQLRSTMRDRILNSPLCDLDGITQSLENAYLQMCGGKVNITEPELGVGT